MNDLQKYLALRKVTARQIADATKANYHSVQKTIKGTRIIQVAKPAIAGYLGVAEELLWGDDAPTALRLLISQEIDRRAERERARLRARYLREKRGTKVAKPRKSSNA